MKKERLKNIELLRFFFAVSIVYFHLLHSFMMPYTQGAEIYQLLADQSRYAKYIVECFFIMSGCFLYRSLLARPDQTAWDFLTKKILRLWPVLAVSTVLSVVFLDVPLDQGILNLFFLQSTGLTTGWKGLNWYVSAFFFAEVFYFLLYKVMKNSKAMKLLICLLVYFGYVLNITSTEGGFGRAVVHGVFSLAMARAVAGVGLGYLLGNIYDSLKKRVQTAAPEAKKKLIQWISLTEIISFLGLLYDFFMGKAAGKNQFVVVILFSALFLCMLTEKGILSRLASRIPLWKFGKYAYSIYVMQETAFYILEKTLWKNTELLKEHAGAALLFSLTGAVILGILSYYAVEKPAAECGRRVYLCRETVK